MQTRPILISPSILAADFSRLGDEVKALDAGGADWIHLDIMDGHFVPNISFGLPVLQSLRPHTKKLFDVHLMIAPVDPYLQAVAAAGADLISVHAEAGPHLHRSVETIRGLGKMVGAALSPATPVSVLEHVLDDIDLILILTVNPGFGGQSFIPAMLQKIRQARDLIGSRNIHIEVDGGITENNAEAVVRAGANVLVAGSGIFKGGDYARNINRIRSRTAVEA